jgi:hypothetical protein
MSVTQQISDIDLTQIPIPKYKKFKTVHIRGVVRFTHSDDGSASAAQNLTFQHILLVLFQKIGLRS